MSYYSELLEDMPQGIEPRFGDCGNQEGVGLLGCNGVYDEKLWIDGVERKR